jgi:NAD(P)-dependent dehydrogenase (short-subunit alcohol dehydrogenase family)
METIDGRVVIVTGAARGIGRGHALEFARAGYRVVVNDLGAEVDGSGSSTGPAGEVVDEIRALGGEAIANGDDVADWSGAQRLVASAVEHFGDLHVLVNNAGILRDRMLVNMSAEEWDAVIRVHLRGTFAPLRHAAAYWRERIKGGTAVDARVINTTSSSGIYGNPGQTNYGAAKAGIAALTVIASMELARYGVTVNAVAPAALTRMTENLRPDRPGVPEGEFDAGAPDNIAPLVVWLAGPTAREVTGRVFNIRGGRLSVAEGWSAGPGVDRGERWTQEALDDVLPDLLARAAPNARQDGQRPAPVGA